MYKLKALLVIYFLTDSLSSFSCGNEYSRSEPPFYNNRLHLKPLVLEMKNTNPYWHHGDDYLAQKRYDSLLRKLAVAVGLSEQNRFNIGWPGLQMALDKNVDYKLLSDLAWNELKLHNKDHAVKLLEALYIKHPNEYNILANLGTAYEVTGKNEKALELLKKAVAINPQSHYGSEWIHVKILEQKVKVTPDYTLILDLGAGKDFQQWLSGSVYNKSIKADSLMVQIAYQLHERISFVPKPDAIVGQLILDFADLVPLSYKPSEAILFYRHATIYYPPLAPVTAERIRQIPYSPPKKTKTRQRSV